ncbi:HMG box domain-containing protein [Aphelenchoides besseyi]|nr:HMG box domain-containing protein [Aphelenchoides besseyi]
MPKKEKDPNAPKRPMSSFFIWMKENRERLKKPGMSAAEVAMIGGDEWRKLEDKSEWEEKAEIERQRYERELDAYNASK